MGGKGMVALPVFYTLAIRARLVGEVVGLPHGETGVWVGFSPIDTSAIPEGFDVEYTFTATIAKAGGGTRTVVLTSPAYAASGMIGGVSNVPAANDFQILNLAKGEHVRALNGGISVLGSNGPLFTWRYAVSAQFSVHPTN